MNIVPNLSAKTLAQAKAVWEQTIDTYGSSVTFTLPDGTGAKTVKAFYKRPKILGLFDRTQGSYDQERYMVMVKASDFADVSPSKFMRATWGGEDHMFISVTEVSIANTVFGYRILVKG